MVMWVIMGAIGGSCGIIGVEITNAFGDNIWFKRSLGYLFSTLCMQLLQNR
eukprot:UN11964